MAELKIPLASNEITLRKEDLSRAMFCALAISQEDDIKEVEDKLKQHPDLQFEEIHISDPNLDGEPIQKFVVASAEDIIFIAFQGMVTPTDFIISDLKFDEQLGVNFHKGFFTRSNVFYGGQSPYRQLLLKELLRSKQRVIFCGHSLGGAVSHMVLLRFLLENRLHHPKPVQYANFRSNGEGGSYLKIRGKNLLFLSEPVSLNGMPCRDILHRTQNELWVSNPKEFSEQGASQDANYMVSIKTAFGRASQLVTEDFVEESGTMAAVNLLPKIWQCMLVMAQPPLGVLPNTEDLNTLDEIIQCAFEQEVETKLSCRLRSIADGKDPSNHVQEADKFIKDDVLKNFLTSSLWIKYKPNTYTEEYNTAVSGVTLATTATATGIAAGVVSAGAAVTAALTLMTGGLGMLAGVLIFVAAGSAIFKGLDYVPVRNIESYDEVLELAIREAKQWKSPQTSYKEVLDLAIREAKRWKSPQKSDEATMPMEQRIKKEHELMCQGFNLVKPYPFQSDVV